MAAVKKWDEKMAKLVVVEYLFCYTAEPAFFSSLSYKRKLCFLKAIQSEAPEAIQGSGGTTYTSSIVDHDDQRRLVQAPSSSSRISLAKFKCFCFPNLGSTNFNLE